MVLSSSSFPKRKRKTKNRYIVKIPGAIYKIPRERLWKAPASKPESYVIPAWTPSENSTYSLAKSMIHISVEDADFVYYVFIAWVFRKTLALVIIHGITTVISVNPDNELIREP